MQRSFIGIIQSQYIWTFLWLPIFWYLHIHRIDRLVWGYSIRHYQFFELYNDQHMIIGRNKIVKPRSRFFPNGSRWEDAIPAPAICRKLSSFHHQVSWYSSIWRMYWKMVWACFPTWPFSLDRMKHNSNRSRLVSNNSQIIDHSAKCFWDTFTTASGTESYNPENISSINALGSSGVHTNLHTRSNRYGIHWHYFDIRNIPLHHCARRAGDWCVLTQILSYWGNW